MNSDESARSIPGRMAALTSSVAPFLRAEERAKAYAEQETRSGFFIGIAAGSQDPRSNERVRVQPVFSDVPLPGSLGFGIYYVDNPPGTVDLARTLTPETQHLYAYLGHAAGKINRELFIPLTIADGPKLH